MLFKNVYVHSNMTNDDLIDLFDSLTRIIIRMKNYVSNKSASDIVELSKKFKMINWALAIFAAIDDHPEENFRFTQTVLLKVKGYRDMYLKQKHPAVQATLHKFYLPVPNRSDNLSESDVSPHMIYSSVHSMY